MKSLIDTNSGNVKAVSQWYHIAVAMAFIGCAFSLIVSAFLVINFFQTSTHLPKLEEQLQILKEEIRDKSDDQQILSQMRVLDLQIRKYRFRRLDFSYKGTFLLFSGLTVLLIGAKGAGAFKKKMPVPRLHTNLQDEQIHRAVLALWTITFFLAVLVTGTFLLSFWPQINFSVGWGLPHHDLNGGLKPALPPSKEQISRNWHRFRGPGGLGVSSFANIPISWNGKTGDGILWMAKVPLPGNNSPVVWETRVFLSGADGNKQQIYCFDAFSGKLLWTGDVTHSQDAEPIKVEEYTGFAAPTVTTDGRRVYAIFATGDVAGFDFEGQKIWQKSLGRPDNSYGYASSLEMYQNLLLIQYDQGAVEDGMSRLIALDGFSGRIVWETRRPVASSWSSPIVADIGGKYQLITVANPWVIAYNPADGTEIWRAKCISGDAAPSPIYAGGLVFVVEPDTKMIAIKPDGRGDVTQTHIAWKTTEGGPNICSPVSNGEVVFYLLSEGLISCHKVTDGAKIWEKDLRESFQTSPSIVGNKLYLLNEDGVMFIIEIGSEYKELAKCELGEKCSATPAFADGRIYIRGMENLYCIGNKSNIKNKKSKLMNRIQGPVVGGQ